MIDKKDDNNFAITLPRLNNEFYGYEEIEDLFLKKIKNEKLSNSYIFYGIKGVGKATFAFRLARYLLNSDKNLINNKNLFIDKNTIVFNQISNLTHPDFLLIESDSKNLSINTENLQRINKQIYKTSSASDRKVIIIDAIDDITTNKTKNILLKLLEDCPKNCIFLIISNNINKVPSTIQSRSQKIYFSPINIDKFKTWLLKSSKVSENDIDAILNISNGSLGRALEIIQNKNYLEVYRKAESLIHNINDVDVKKLNNLFLDLDKEININLFFLIIQYQLKSYVEKLISNNQDGNIDLFIEASLKMGDK